VDYSFPPRHHPQVPGLDDRLRPEQVAELLGVTVSTLKNWRSQGKGPAFYRLGRIFYSRQDVYAWIASRRTDCHDLSRPVIGTRRRTP
jgi:predicted DNA-binding transcriptional regulator AlpA